MWNLYGLGQDYSYLCIFFCLYGQWHTNYHRSNHLVLPLPFILKCVLLISAPRSEGNLENYVGLTPKSSLLPPSFDNSAALIVWFCTWIKIQNCFQGKRVGYLTWGPPVPYPLWNLSVRLYLEPLWICDRLYNHNWVPRGMLPRLSPF